RSRSTSSHTIMGFLPPSSSVTDRTALEAARCWMSRPVVTLPVNAMRRTSGWVTSASPVAGDDTEHAGREGLPDEVTKKDRRHRRLLSRLEHHGVAGHERREAPLDGEEQRVVVGDDLRDDAVWRG